MSIRENLLMRRLVYEFRAHKNKISNIVKGYTIKDTIRANGKSGCDHYIFLHWAESKNFGDWASWELTKILSSKVPLSTRSHYALRGQVSYSCIGSVLQWPERIPCEVWGSGFISGSSDMLIKPKAVHAVRGPLTREKLLKVGVSCPEVYGDPASLLFRKHLKENVKKEYKIGIIPHYVDSKDPLVKELSKNDNVAIIDVFSSIESIADLCQKCEVIDSSSLHGLIIADTLRVPNVWIALS